jgi:type IV pilus assembly protein PilC
MNISSTLGTFWYVWIVAPILLVLIWRIALRNQAFAWRMDSFKLHMPLTGRLMVKTIVARFSRTLGTLLQSGVPILEGLAIVRNSMENRVMEDAIADVHDAIREGEGMAEPLSESGIFDDIVINMIDVGEETGQLDSMLLRVADTYEMEVDNEVTAVLKTLEPTIIFIMAIVVGTIVVSLFLPVVRIMDTFQGS